MSISALISVYNEEYRLEFTLKTLQWCDEILVLDKGSTDNTVSIAQRYGAKVFNWGSLEYSHNESVFLLEKCTSEWIISFTASDVIHPSLAMEIKRLINDSDFQYDIIYVPFRTFILGVDSKRSPWHTELKPSVYKKNSITFNSGVHNSASFSSTRKFIFKKDTEFCIFHLTHVNIETMMERHTRYWRAEAEYFDEKDLKKPFKRIIHELYNVILKRKTYLIGWDGIMLGCAYLSYFMMSFVYKWEKKYNNAPEVYHKIRNNLLSEWEKMK
jgi:glycosyltransferase involved in cell wall biosynthesis